MPNHERVNRSAGEHMKGDAHKNTAESCFATFYRAAMGILHKISRKHMDRYVAEFAGSHNDRHSDTFDQMADPVRGMLRKRLKFKELIRPNGPDSMARDKCREESG